MTRLHDHENEQAVLACAMLETDLAHTVVERTVASDFNDEEHRQIRLAIEAALAGPGVCDERTVTAQLDSAGHSNMAATVALLSVSLPNPGGLSAYLDRLLDLSKRRQLRRLLRESWKRFEDQSVDLVDAVAQMVQRAENLIDESDGDEMVDGQQIAEMMSDLKNRKPENARGIWTGFADLDQATNGWKPNQLVIVAARPGMGKSAFAKGLEIGALRSGAAVASFNYEMSVSENVMRMASQMSGVPFARIERGVMLPREAEEVDRAAEEVRAGMQIYASDKSSLTVPKIHAICRRLKRYRSLDLVVVDYLGIMPPTNPREPREQQVAVISRGLKQMASDLGVPVIALSQLNRKCEERTNKRPLLSDLRDSGAVEQDADIVLFLYRDEFYNSSSELKGLAEVQVAKQRNGETPNITLGFVGESMTFVNFCHDEPPPGQQEFVA